MKKYIQVDVYGKCGGLKCKSYKNKTVNRFSECDRQDLSRDYLFYLAFENSICTDYITEKFYDTLKNDLEPVVLGAGPYDQWIPKSGFIDVKDFSNVKQLTDYLLYLSQNSTAYNAYFKWKKYIKFERAKRNICDMCIQLNLESIYGIKEGVLENVNGYLGYKSNCKWPVLKHNGDFHLKEIDFK
jgi:alpha-1,3-fucosyltransferase